MNTAKIIAWSYIPIAVSTLAFAAVITGGETGKAELRFAEAATTAGATSDALDWLVAAVRPATPAVQ